MQSLPPVLEAYVEGLKAHDVEKVAHTVSDDLAFVSAGRTLDKPQFLAMLHALYAAFPDWRYDHDPPGWKGDAVAIRWRQGGTHTGPWAMPGLDTIAATGKKVAIPAQQFFYKIRDGRIVEIRPDPIPGGAPGGILAQIGIESPPL